MTTADCAIFTMSLSFSAPDPFSRFVPGFYEALAAMDPAPAEIVVACPPVDHSGVDVPPECLAERVRIVRVDSRHPSDFLSAAVEHAGTTWLSWCGIDDRVTPDALKDVASADADVISAKYSGDGVVLGEWSPRRMATEGVNPVAPNSPFTKDAYARAGGWPRIYFDDWGLWLRMAKAGVRVVESGTVGLLMDLGRHHVTRSGLQMPGWQRDAAMAEIKALVAELWPDGYR